MEDIFIRSRMLLGSEAMEALSKSHVAVFGVGGVGSFAAEALARSGIGILSLVDYDRVSPSNINRQIQALHSTVGMYKAEVMGKRVLDINPDCDVRPLVKFYSAETRSEFDFDYDYIIDAIDLVSSKLDLIESAKRLGLKIISSMGAGNKLDPFRFEISDISKTSVCPLARVLRRELRKRGLDSHTVLYSTEAPVVPLPLEEPPPGRRSLPSSATWVASCAGLMLAGHVIQELGGISRP